MTDWGNQWRFPDALEQDITHGPTPAVYRRVPAVSRSWRPPIDDPDHFEVRRVSRNGGIRWSSAWVNVSHVLGEPYVGLEEVDDGLWDLYFGSMRLGQFQERALLVEDVNGRTARTNEPPMPPVVQGARPRPHAHAQWTATSARTT